MYTAGLVSSPGVMLMIQSNTKNTMVNEQKETTIFQVWETAEWTNLRSPHHSIRSKYWDQQNEIIEV
ncbi:hypothetical protein PSTT_09205 [Puccinia striiformis]|uniref:Uncharacterized protein n=1 Tax=Puccinia striiformis TaxID=27350 RepID=A0A2S4V9I8_9BASI|nr:hypothetical protein PSTT_09205 [Puccinia striiformis]